jgi:N-acetylmuramoyl-L-alanine amidase
VIVLPLTNREMFARLIKCEAGGEGDIGMKAVASVVMNRVHVPYGEYLTVNQGDIRKVLTQEGQFTCLEETVGGEYNPQNIYNMRPEQIHYDIADWAMSGSTLGAVGESLWYFNPYNPDCPAYFPRNQTGVIENHIHEHCFYIPTQKYALT